MSGAISIPALVAFAPKAFLFHFNHYIVSAAGVYFLFYKTPWFKVRQFPGTTSHVSFRQFRREFILSTLSCVIFGIGSVFTLVATLLGWTRLEMKVTHFSIAYEVIMVIVLLVLFDAWFYLSHAILHRAKYARRLHKGHHLSNPPSPWAAMSFEPGETAFYAAFFVVAAFIVPMTITTYSAVLWIAFLQSAIIHSVYEIYPSWWRFPMTNVYHHFLHHKRGQGNFGLYFIWLDRLFRTVDTRYMTQEHPTVPALSPRTAIRRK